MQAGRHRHLLTIVNDARQSYAASHSPATPSELPDLEISLMQLGVEQSLRELGWSAAGGHWDVLATSVGVSTAGTAAAGETAVALPAQGGGLGALKQLEEAEKMLALVDQYVDALKVSGAAHQNVVVLVSLLGVCVQLVCRKSLLLLWHRWYELHVYAQGYGWMCFQKKHVRK